LLNKFHDLLQPYGKREQDSSIQQKKNDSCPWPQCLYSCRVGVAHRQGMYMKFAIRFGEKAAATSARRPSFQFPAPSSQLPVPSSTCNTGQPTSLAGPGEIFNAESLIAIAAASAAAHFRHLLVFRLHFPQSQDLQHRTWTAHRLMVDIIKFDARHLLTTAPCLGGLRPGCQDARMPGCHVARTHFHQPAFEWPRN